MVNMAVKMVCGNREMLVPSEEKEKYLKLGFSVIDESGNVVEKGKKSIRDLEAELEAATKKNASLKSDLEAANRKNEVLEAELENALKTKAESSEKKK